MRHPAGLGASAGILWDDSRMTTRLDVPDLAVVVRDADPDEPTDAQRQEFNAWVVQAVTLLLEADDVVAVHFRSGAVCYVQRGPDGELHETDHFSPDDAVDEGADG